jgi:hypothetical protein
MIWWVQGRPLVSLTPEALYLQLGSLVAQMPDLANGPITPEMNQWLGRAAALIEEAGDQASATRLQNCAQFLDSINRALNAQAIAAIVHHALAKAELKAPAAVPGRKPPPPGRSSWSRWAAEVRINWGYGSRQG